MTRIAEIVDRLRRMAKRREDEGIYTDAALCEEAATLLEHSTAAIGAGGQAVAVKPLTWEQPDPHVWLGHGTDMCQYYLRHEDGSWWHPGDSEDAEEFDTIEAAKAAAQADFERRILSALSQPHPADERVVEAERRRSVGQGMAIAAGIVMNGWGNTVYAKEILGAAGYTSVEAMKADGVEDYDIDLCRPALEELSTKEGRKNG